MTITLRLDKGSELTHAELDGNFTDLVNRAEPATPGAFNPASIDLSKPGHTHHQPYSQSGAISLALSGATHVPGATVSVRITGDGSNITASGNVVWADNNGQEARTLSGTALLQAVYIGDYAGDGAPRAVVAIAAAGGGGGGGGAAEHETITAAGDFTVITDDDGATKEFAMTSAQRILLPAASGFSRGFGFGAVALADDATFGGFPLTISSSSGDMRSQAGVANWNVDEATLQVGAVSSQFAQVWIQRIGDGGSEQWLVSGDFIEELELETGSLQSLRHEWRVDDLVGSGGTITLSGSDVTQWDAFAGLDQIAFAPGTAPSIAGTAGTSDYRIVFDGASGENLVVSYSGAPTDNLAWGIVFTLDQNWDNDTEILRTGSFGDDPRFILRTAEGATIMEALYVQADGTFQLIGTSDFELNGLRDGNWHAVVLTVSGSRVEAYTDLGERLPASSIGEGHIAASMIRLGDPGATAGQLEVKYLARWDKVPDAREIEAWMAWAVSNVS